LAVSSKRVSSVIRRLVIVLSWSARSRIIFATLSPSLFLFDFRRRRFPHIGVFVFLIWVLLLSRWLHINLVISHRLLKLVSRRLWLPLLNKILLDILLVILVGHILVLIKPYRHVMMLKRSHLTEMSLHTLNFFFLGKLIIIL
jgi:hypothetical protein